MANDISYLKGLDIKSRELWQAQAEYNADKVVVEILDANVTPEPTSAAWSYTVNFRLKGEVSGLIIPYTGDVAASAADTSTAGTASVGDSTPAVTMGYGSVVFSGDEADWLDTETATLTVTYTNLRGGTDTDTFVVTFTAV